MTWAAAAACMFAGCSTISNARRGQRAMARYTNDVAVVRAPARVNLVGSSLQDYVAFAAENRPSLEAARLAVSSAALALVSVRSDRCLQMSVSGGYSQSTANTHEFSWHQRRGKGTADVSFDLLIYDFGRVDARERAAREDFIAAKRALAEAELAVFDEVCQAYFTLLRSDALLEVARTNAPSLMVLRARLRAAVADVDYAVADLMPNVTFSSAFSFVDPAWNWSWGFRAVQSVIDGFRKRTAVDAAVVAMENARTAVEAAEQKLSCDLAVAAATRDNARQSLDTARVEVAQARENFENVMMQYRVGDASRLDFTDAASTLASALGARVKAFYAAEMAEAALVRLTGLDPWSASAAAVPSASIEDLEE